MAARGDVLLPPPARQRIPKTVPCSSFWRDHVGPEISDSESHYQKEGGDSFFETYRACVLTLRNAPESPLLKERLDLRLTELIQSTYGDIFPPRGFLAQSNAPRLGSVIKK